MAMIVVLLSESLPASVGRFRQQFGVADCWFAPIEMESVLSEVGTGRSRFDSLLFDLDDTLYPLSSGLAVVCRQRIQQFMVERLGMEASTVPDVCLRLYHRHGTTLAGLIAEGFRVDVHGFHAFVHGALPYDALHPDPVLRRLLLSMPQRKLVFTNADRVHALEVLRRLGLEDCFEGVISLESIQQAEDCGIVCKPAQEAFRRAVEIAQVDAATTLFLDDSVRNIAAARIAGLNTVLVGSSERSEGACYAVASLHNLREAMPDICQERDSTDELSPCATNAIEVQA